jgi:arylsulfatase A-like enzyme
MKQQIASEFMFTRRAVLKHSLSAVASLSTGLWLSGCGRKAPRDAPNVVFLLIDALRADHLPCYGYKPEVAPNIDALASRAMLFKRVIAPSSWTKTSMASIMTGRGPWRHGVKGVKDTLPAELTTMAEAFSKNGYHTIGVNTNPWLKPMFGFDAGFDHYTTLDFSAGFADAFDVNNSAMQAISARPASKPAFVYLHYMDVHAPYTPEPPYFNQPPIGIQGGGTLPDNRLEFMYRKQGLRGPVAQQRVIDLYDGEIRTVDAAVAEFIDKLQNIRGFENTLYVITSDHGESFLEHGTTEHGWNLYPEVYEVPLLLIWKEHLSAGQEISAQVRSIDIPPTLFALSGIPKPESFDGKAIITPTDRNVKDRMASCEVGTNDYVPDKDYVAVVSKEYLYVREKTENNTEFYDLKADPGALKDLGQNHPQYEFYAALEPKSHGAKSTAQTELDEQTRQQLESLGYLH